MKTQTQHTAALSYKCDDRDYFVSMEIRDLDAFTKASQDTSVKGKSGEALVAAIQAAAPGCVSLITRRARKSYLSCIADEFKEHPVKSTVTTLGALMIVPLVITQVPELIILGGFGSSYFSTSLAYSFWKASLPRYQDGSNGEPAIQRFDEKGTVIEEIPYKDGVEVEVFLKDRHDQENLRSVRASLPQVRVS